jgi:hypothetical protein
MRVVQESTTRAERKFVMSLEKEEPSSSRINNRCPIPRAERSVPRPRQFVCGPAAMVADVGGCLVL